jgi:hypothetical protein
MILLALIVALQYFITGANAWPGLQVFIFTVIGQAVETVIELKILSLKSLK